MATVATPAPAGSSSPQGAPLSRRLAAQRLLLAVPVAVFAVQAWAHRWVIDDGFINLRVVRQVLDGNGPVWNEGQRVEAFTSPLWIAVVTLGEVLLPVPLEWVPVLLGIVASTAGLALATAGAAHLWGGTGREGLLVPAGALVVLGVYAMGFFATAGLEGGLVFAWLGGSLLLLARASTADGLPSRWVAVVLGLGWLLRPDLAVMTAAFLVAVAVMARGRASRRQLAAFVAVALALPAAYQLFRMGYYGSLLPNTAFAKGAGEAYWVRGWRYLRDLVGTYELWVPALLLAAGAVVPLVRHLQRTGRQRALPVVVAFLGGSALSALYVVRVGGDYHHARLLLPSLFAAIAPVAVVRVQRATLPALLVLPWAAVSAFAFTPDHRFITALDGRTNLVTAEEVVGHGEPLMPWFTGEGIWWEDRRLDVPPGPDVERPTVARLAIGLPGYALGTDVDVFDAVGLADPLTARFDLVRRGVPGHEKPIPPPWAAARLAGPGADVEGDELTPGGFGFVRPLVPPTTGEAFEEQTEQARRVLGCGRVSDLRRSYREPLTVRRFLSNVVGSFRSLTLEVPPDPAEAERRFC